MKIVIKKSGSIAIHHPSPEALRLLRGIPSADKTKLEDGVILVASKHASLFTNKFPECVEGPVSWSDFYLTSNAPEYILDAVWRALASKYHPDKGGDTKTFQKLLSVYNKLKSSFGKK